MSCAAVPLRPDPAPPGVPAPAGAHRGAGGLSELRHLLRPLADPEVLAHLARLRASAVVWPPPVVRAGPTVRSPQRGRGDGGVRRCGLAVVAAVRAKPGTGLHDLAAHVRVEGGVDAGRSDVDDALVCLHLLGIVAKGPRGRWLPGPLTLEELPVPIPDLEATWARERRKRVKHAYRYR